MYKDLWYECVKFGENRTICEFYQTTKKNFKYDFLSISICYISKVIKFVDTYQGLKLAVIYSYQIRKCSLF